MDLPGWLPSAERGGARLAAAADVGRAARAADTASDAARVGRAADVADNAADAGRVARQADRTADAGHGLNTSQIDNIRAIEKGNRPDPSERGDLHYVEEALGWEEGALSLSDDVLVRVDIPDPQELNLRIPSGNEAGASDYWIPGGRLPDGAPEAVIDAADLPAARYTVRALAGED